MLEKKNKKTTATRVWWVIGHYPSVVSKSIVFSYNDFGCRIITIALLHQTNQVERQASKGFRDLLFSKFFIKRRLILFFFLFFFWFLIVSVLRVFTMSCVQFYKWWICQLSIVHELAHKKCKQTFTITYQRVAFNNRLPRRKKYWNISHLEI